MFFLYVCQVCRVNLQLQKFARDNVELLPGNMELLTDTELTQGGSDGSGRHSAAPMLTAIMSGGVGISGRELSWSC